MSVVVIYKGASLSWSKGLTCILTVNLGSVNLLGFWYVKKTPTRKSTLLIYEDMSCLPIRVYFHLQQFSNTYIGIFFYYILPKAKQAHYIALALQCLKIVRSGRCQLFLSL